MARSSADTRPTVRSEGGLLPHDLLDRIADPRERDLPGLDPVANYGLEPNLRITEAAAQSWERAKAYWGALQARLEAARPGTELGITRQNWLIPLLEELGYAELDYRQQPQSVNGREFRISHRASAEPDAPPLHLVAVTQPLDKSDPDSPGPKASPHGYLQSYLNETDHLWGIVSNGRQLRILRDNASLTRPAYLEFDLEGMMEGGVFADFTLLWMVAHRSRLPRSSSDAISCMLEQWYEASLVRGARALGDLRLGVEQAIRSLGQGFIDHPRNEELREKLASGELDSAAYYRQLLRIVYRLLFLLVAEERDLLFPGDGGDGESADMKAGRTRGRSVYADSYAVSRLRDQIRRRRGDERHDDLWRAQAVAFRMLREGNEALGLPPLGGGIFDPRTAPELEEARVRNDALRAAIRGLSLAPTKSGYRRINYRDLDVEELGSVYESLLDERPSLHSQGGRTIFSLTASGERKTSGSYYTPSVLVKELVRSTLDPVIQDALASSRDVDGKRRALLSLAVCDPACGSGHFLLEAARRIGRELARLASGEHEPDPAVLRHAIRDAITHCVYGVDVNPLATDLCRLALWLESIEPGKPLGFLDHHVRIGNSLLGTTPELIAQGLPDEAFTAIEGDDKRACAVLKKRNKAQRKGLGPLFAQHDADAQKRLAQAAAALDDLPDDGPEDVREKELAFQHHEDSPDYLQKKVLADAWCAAFFIGKRFEEVGRESTVFGLTREHLNDLATGRQLPSDLAKEVGNLTDHYQFFHWHLAFPAVFSRGGFDCVIGNPPWETLSPDAKEFFSAYDPTIRFLKKSDQQGLINELLEVPTIAREWSSYRRDLYGSVHFMKTSGRYRHMFAEGNLGKGDFDLYRAFVETAMSITRPEGGVGQVVKSGFYNGANSQGLRKEFFNHWQLGLVFGFLNTNGYWFPGVHPETRFAIYSARKAGSTSDIRTAFKVETDTDLRAAITSPIVTSLTAIVEQSPKTLAIPETQSELDSSIALRMQAMWPPLGDASASPPLRHFQREIDMGTDRDRFGDSEMGLPLFEGRMIDQYDHRAKAYRSGRGRAAVWEPLPFGHPGKAIVPQWRIPTSRIPRKLGDRTSRYRVVWCDVATPTAPRSLIAALVPPDSICGDTCPTMRFPDDFEWAYMPWLAVANSFCMDFIARRKISLHLKYTQMDSLPFPRFTLDDPFVQVAGPLALRLTCTASEMNAYWNAMEPYGWARCIREDSKPPGLVDPSERLDAQAQIDALVAHHIFSLTRDELAFVLDSFEAVRRVEEKSTGEYRTKLRVLAWFDRLH